MLDLAGRPLDLAAEVHMRGSEDLQVMDGIHHKEIKMSRGCIAKSNRFTASARMYS